MNLQETYLGIVFSIRDCGGGTYGWSVTPPMDPLHPDRSTAIIMGGQNEAILAARKAIGLHRDSTAIPPVRRPPV